MAWHAAAARPLAAPSVADAGGGGASFGRGVEQRQNGCVRIFSKASDDGLGALWLELPEVVECGAGYRVRYTARC